MPIKWSLFAVTPVLLFLPACASFESRGPFLAPRPLGGDLPDSRVERGGEGPGFHAPIGGVTLRDALAAALALNPGLAAFSWEARALDAEALQAGLLPNPEIEGEIEDFGGSGDARGVEDAEVTLRVSQLFELGGKRRKRAAVAAFARDLGGWDYKSARLRVLTDTTQAFVEVLAAQRRVNLAEEAARLARETYEAVSERVDAGKVSPLERERTRVLASSSRIALDQTRRDLQIARRGLAVLWGSESPGFDQVVGDLEDISPVPPLSALLELLERNPDVARWEAEQALRNAQLDLERAAAVPDLTGSAGFKRLTGPDETAFVVGVGIELPVFDRNQGAIRAARRRISKAREESRAAVTQASAALRIAHERLVGAWLAARSLRGEVLPVAERTFAAVQDAYQQGKAGYLEVLDAQAALVEARSTYVDTLESYHRTRAELERLISGPLNSGANEGGGER